VDKRFCREVYTASGKSGRRMKALTGSPYDCRKRGWYFSTKKNLKKQWTGM
jgi:hypothetical protein